MRFTEFKTTLLEGGNIFKDATGTPITTRIAKEAIPETIQWLESITGLPLINNTLGSVGKKESSGDLDIAVDENAISKDQLAERLTAFVQKLGKDPKGWIRKSGVSVHFLTPIRGDANQGFVQTDFMFGPDIEQMKFGLWSAGDASKYSGADRNLIMSSIAKSTGMKYSWQKGLMNRDREEVITTNPDAVARYLLGQDASQKDLVSVETIMAALAKTPQRVTYLKALVPKLRDPTDKKPGSIKADNEEADRIENALRVLQ
jgi:hypothetical protein